MVEESGGAGVPPPPHPNTTPPPKQPTPQNFWDQRKPERKMLMGQQNFPCQNVLGKLLTNKEKDLPWWLGSEEPWGAPKGTCQHGGWCTTSQHRKEALRNKAPVNEAPDRQGKSN